MKETKARSKPAKRKTDMQDSPEDADRLQNEETTIDLPDVKDIPGQEHISVPNMDQFKDTTISSDDEEGKDVWTTELVEDDVITDQSSNLTQLEKEMLELGDDMPTRDEQQLRRAMLDDRDDDGDLLNEKTSTALSGSDLDVPGADDDNANENLGEEDEENNPYSLGGDDQSINEERSGT